MTFQEARILRCSHWHLLNAQMGSRLEMQYMKFCYQISWVACSLEPELEWKHVLFAGEKKQPWKSKYLLTSRLGPDILIHINAKPVIVVGVTFAFRENHKPYTVLRNSRSDIVDEAVMNFETTDTVVCQSEIIFYKVTPLSQTITPQKRCDGNDCGDIGKLSKCTLAPVIFLLIITGDGTDSDISAGGNCPCSIIDIGCYTKSFPINLTACQDQVGHWHGMFIFTWCSCIYCGSWWSLGW